LACVQPDERLCYAAVDRSRKRRACCLVARLWEALTYATTPSAGIDTSRELPVAAPPGLVARELERVALSPHLTRLDLGGLSNDDNAPFALLASAVLPQCTALRSLQLSGSAGRRLPACVAKAWSPCVRLTA